jgi:8-oxo-dGTP pyrophosphatase MutT (NUDIX family)
VDAKSLTERLAHHQPDDPSDFLVKRRAAVAAILRFGAGVDVLLMTRAQRESDRWSGHVSMPGGMQHEGELLIDTAIRETREETGIDLTAVPHLGRLAACKAIAKGQVLAMTITPYIFRLVDPQPVVLNHEAVDHFWFPLDRAARGELDARYDYRFGPMKLDLPCWTWEGRTVWGLTHQMLTSLIEVVRG